MPLRVPDAYALGEAGKPRARIVNGASVKQRVAKQELAVRIESDRCATATLDFIKCHSGPG